MAVVVIKPTVGRVLWYYPHGKTQVDAGKQPHAAMVAYVHGDSCVNIGYLDGSGNHRNQTSVRLVHQGEELPESGFCAWMPYQMGQAARTEAAEKAAGKS